MPARPQQQRSPQPSQLFLRIRHPTMDPREVTNALAIEPIQTVACGASVESVHVASARLAARLTALTASRSSSKCWALTAVVCAVSCGSANVTAVPSAKLL